ncbi:MAG: hypothetical protein JNL82_36680 [Myxococcales bacterium]|nr:hypothetical protein [Myxococcales bacterium]
MKRTLAYQFWKRQVVILVHSKDAPADDEWEEYIRDVRTWAPTIRAVLVISEGGGPNSLQREQMEHALDRERFKGKTAVVTLSRVARGIVTALSWFNPNIKAFSTIQIPAALEYLEVPKPDHDAIQKEIRALRVKLSLPPE